MEIQQQPISFPKERPLPPIPNTANNNDTIVVGSDELASPSKLTNVEAQRIMSVLSEIQKKVILIGMLPDQVDRRVSTVFNGDLLNILNENHQLEQKFIALQKTKQTAIKNNQNLDSITNEIREVSKQMRYTTRLLYRKFIHTPGAVSKLRLLKSTKTEPIEKFEALLQEVRALVYERLKTTVEEEKFIQDQLLVIIAKEQKTNNEVTILQDELEKAKRERSNEVNKKNEIIRKLKDELRQIKREAEESTKKLETRSKQKEDNDIQKSHDKEQALILEIEQSKAKLAELTLKNREEEALLRKKKFKVESEVENWIHKYDQDLEEKQTELEDTTAIFNEEKAQLDELQARYEILHIEYQKIMKERGLAEEKKKKQEEQLAREIVAAIKIQALWKGIMLRKAIAKTKKKGKPGKGGKKK